MKFRVIISVLIMAFSVVLTFKSDDSTIQSNETGEFKGIQQ